MEDEEDLWDEEDFNDPEEDDDVVREYVPPHYDGPYAGEGGIDF